jgi:threonine dehydratase
VRRRCADAGLETLDLTDDELAKLHVRHMVGGHAPLDATSCSTASSFPSARAR